MKPRDYIEGELPTYGGPGPGTKPDKGLKGGSCNRTACQQPPATWFNVWTRAWYCGPCARDMNEVNKTDFAGRPVKPMMIHYPELEPKS